MFERILSVLKRAPQELPAGKKGARKEGDRLEDSIKPLITFRRKKKKKKWENRTGGGEGGGRNSLTF